MPVFRDEPGAWLSQCFLDSSVLFRQGGWVRNWDLDAWERLGRAVKYARRQRGMDETKKWADRVGRSSRSLLGLERGEPVGEKTLVKIEQALDWPAGRTYEILDGDRVSVRASGELLLNEPYAFTVSRESGEVLGVAGDGPIPLDERDWSRWSDTALAELIAQAAEELRERSLGRFVRVLNSTHDIAAYRPERESAYEQETSEQDVAAEGPDTPGPEDGA